VPQQLLVGIEVSAEVPIMAKLTKAAAFSFKSVGAHLCSKVPPNAFFLCQKYIKDVVLNNAIFGRSNTLCYKKV